MRKYIALILSSLLVSASAFAEDAGVLDAAGSSFEMAGSTAQDLSDPFITSTLGADGVAILGGTMLGLLTTGGLLYLWEKSEMRRRYRDASAEANHRLAKGEAEPISNSNPSSSLVLVANLERQNADRAGHSIAQFSEKKIAAMVIVRSAMLERGALELKK